MWRKTSYIHMRQNPQYDSRIQWETFKKGFNTIVATGATLHAMVKGVVKGREIRIMLDTGASSSNYD